MTNKYNLVAFKLSIIIYNKLSNSLHKEFSEALSNELKFNDEVKKLEKIYGIKLSIAEFNKSFRDQHPELIESQFDKLNNGVVFSIFAALVCELALKYLILKSDSSFPKTHNLRKLYEKLDNNQKDSLKKTAMKKSKFISEEDFENQLDSSSENFVTLRYFFEKKEHELNDIFLKGFKDTLIELIINTK